MLNRSQCLWVFSVAIIGGVIMGGLLYWISTFDVWKAVTSGEFWAAVLFLGVVVLFVWGPFALDKKEQNDQRERDEEERKERVAMQVEARKHEILNQQHLAHLKFMAQKQSETTIHDQYAKFVNKWGEAQQSMILAGAGIKIEDVVPAKQSKPIETYKFINDLN